ncbi:MAG: hypothetical protein ACRDHZ_24245 [Ktedonobacteraceae bacterium]
MSQAATQFIICDEITSIGGVGNPVVLNGSSGSIAFYLRVIALTGTTPSLQVYIQHSPDEGSTWLDFISFTAADVPSTQVASWSRSTAGSAVTQCALTGSGVLYPGTVLNGPIADDMVRVLWTLTGTSPNAEFSVLALIPGVGNNC